MQEILPFPAGHVQNRGLTVGMGCKAFIVWLSCATIAVGQSQIEITDTAAEEPLRPGEQEIIIESTPLPPIEGQSAIISTNARPITAQIRNLPPNVRNTIQSHGGQVESISTRNVNGRTVYQIKFLNSARLNSELYVAQDGLVIREPAGASTEAVDDPVLAPSTAALTLADVPPAVQDVVRTYSGGARLKIGQKAISGRTVYEVQFARDGAVRQLEIGADGTVLSDR